MNNYPFIENNVLFSIDIALTDEKLKSILKSLNSKIMITESYF